MTQGRCEMGTSTVDNSGGKSRSFVYSDGWMNRFGPKLHARVRAAKS